MPKYAPGTGGLKKLLHFALEWKADAIIGQFEENGDLGIFREHGIMAISQDYMKRFKEIPNITADYEDEGKICAEYLISQGAKNFAFYGLEKAVWSDERKIGFRKAIGERLENFTFSVKERSDMASWWYDLSDLTGWIRELPKPVAILACDDNMASHIAEACNQTSHESGMKIPNDILLLGVDNDENLCQLCLPRLSSFSQQVEQAGYDTARLLDERMKMSTEERFRDIPDIYVKPGTISIRNSTNAFLYDNTHIKTVCAYILQHYTENIKVNDLLSLVPMSRRLLEKTFLTEIGLSIYQYIIKLRVDRMKVLLSEGKLPQEASRSMNMDLKALSRTFKAVTGKSPMEYANQLKK